MLSLYFILGAVLCFGSALWAQATAKRGGHQWAQLYTMLGCGFLVGFIWTQPLAALILLLLWAALVTWAAGA